MTTSCRLSRHLPLVRHFFLRWSTATSRRYVLVPNLAIALVDTTYLEHPVLLPRCLPPTLTYCGGGFQRQRQPCWRKQSHLVARWCRHLCPSRRHHILPTSILLHSMMELFLLPGEGTPIHSVSKDFLFLHGSERGASTAHIVLAGVISLALPINLLVGLRTKGVVY